MDKHVSDLCRRCFYHIRRIALIRKYLDHDATARLISAFVLSLLDNGNSFLVGLTEKHFDRLKLRKLYRNRGITVITDNSVVSYGENVWQRMVECHKVENILAKYGHFLGDWNIKRSMVVMVKTDGCSNLAANTFANNNIPGWDDDEQLPI
ncbi:hypothetical protein DAPPUDRAFT_263774 [Daphnia pulex]|uniref:Uncharacterized protein n=1 Tax=Daphnia pulex TaxID=6669 RepID=E9HQD9_DAPPU|nr:hypothetical protein DAPPUDRAFT_263774 [Daphnia pulex]|eukprot:EFX66039.1 hypothetical protein DAPPUDRAFT_263774 [Daphnia pulex]